MNTINSMNVYPTSFRQGELRILGKMPEMMRDAVNSSSRVKELLSSAADGEILEFNYSPNSSVHLFGTHFLTPGKSITIKFKDVVIKRLEAMRGEFGDEVLTYCLKRLTDLRKLYEEEVEGRRRWQEIVDGIKKGKTNNMSKEESDERFLEMFEKFKHQQKYGW